MKKYISLIVLLFALISCSNDSEEDIIPINPELSSSLANVEEGKTIEIQIINGRGPFSVESSNQSVARVSVTGKTITIIAVAKGNVVINVTGSDSGTSKIDVSVGENVYKNFKSDATLRIERVGVPVIKNIEGQYLFYRDKGFLFGSGKNKIGYGKRDGSAYYILEWEGDSSVGVKSNPTLRDVLGVRAINKFEIIKVENGILWIIFKEKADSSEERFVQRW